MAFAWPETVPVVKTGDVGTDQYFHDAWKESAPCCALGWAQSAGLGDAHGRAYGIRKFCACYVRIAVSEGKRTMYSGSEAVTRLNDGTFDASYRAKLVNATFAALGYVVGNDPEAVRMARRAGYAV